jgi:hypothetical protein
MIKRQVRNVVVLVVSATVVLLVAGYVAIGPSERVYAAIGKVSMTSASRAVVYGKVTTAAGSRPVAGAGVNIFRAGGSKLHLLAHGKTNGKGLYRIVTVAGKLKIVFVVNRHSGSLTAKVKPGEHIEVSAKVARGSKFIFLPVFNY